MHYLPKLLNQRGIFQRLNSALRDESTAESTRKQIERFLYRATCVLVGINSIYRAEGASVTFAKSYVKQLKLPENGRVAIATDPLFEVYSQIHNTVSSLVLMQNSILNISKPILGVDAQTPKSLADAMKKGLAEYGFEKEVISHIQNYWDKYGSYIRDVRNVDEHYDALVDQTFFEFINEPGQIKVFLPDNPNVKSPARFTYDDEIDAAQAIIDTFNALNALFEEICKHAGYEPSQFSNSLSLGQIGILKEGEERTLGLLIQFDGKETKGNETIIKLDTIEMMQVIPKEGGGNVAVRKLKPDSEVNDVK